MFLKELLEKYLTYLPSGIRLKRTLVICAKESGLDLEDVSISRKGDVVYVSAHPAIKNALAMQQNKIISCLAKSGFKIERII